MEEKRGRARAREYSFRAKQTNNNEWVYGSLCETAIGDGYYMYKAFVNKKYSIKQDTIGQYIRQQDKNKKWIYEGDIVRWDFKPLSQASTYTYIGKIVWVEEAAAFVFEHLNNKCQWDLNSNYQNDYEVIGNIYDNPELLGGD